MGESVTMALRIGLVVFVMAAAAPPAAGAEAAPDEAGRPGESLALRDSKGIAEGELDPAMEAFERSRAPFAEGAWTFQTYGSAVFADKDKGQQYTAHAGFGYYFADGWSVNLEALGGWVRSARDADPYGGVGGLDLLGRWHFIRRDGWSIYTDGGAGIQQATTDFPSDNRFNFRLQQGFGGTFRIADQTRLMGGVRYMHISNAGLTDGNDGYDGVQAYVGLMFSF